MVSGQDVVVPLYCGLQCLAQFPRVGIVGATRVCSFNARFFFGDLHPHSRFSDGDVEPEPLLKAVRDRMAVGFMALPAYVAALDKGAFGVASRLWTLSKARRAKPCPQAVRR